MIDAGNRRLHPFEILAAVGRVVEESVTIAGFTVFGPFIFDDFFGVEEFLPATVADAGFSGGGRGRLVAHVDLPACGGYPMRPACIGCMG